VCAEADSGNDLRYALMGYSALPVALFAPPGRPERPAFSGKPRVLVSRGRRRRRTLSAGVTVKDVEDARHLARADTGQHRRGCWQGASYDSETLGTA